MNSPDTDQNVVFKKHDSLDLNQSQSDLRIVGSLGPEIVVLERLVLSLL